MKMRNTKNADGELYIDGSNITAADVNQYIKNKEEKTEKQKNVVEIIKKVGKKEMLKIANAISKYILKNKKPRRRRSKQ